MPAGKPAPAIASTITSAVSSHVPGWPGWPFTITGQRAAKAPTVSVPATPIASGKLLAPKTATGPTPTSIARTSGLGSGCRAGLPWSIRAMQPRTVANHCREQPHVVRRAGELGFESRQRQRRLSVSAVRSARARAHRAPRRWRRAVAAIASGLTVCSSSNAASASCSAASTSAAVASWKARTELLAGRGVDRLERRGARGRALARR